LDSSGSGEELAPGTLYMFPELHLKGKENVSLRTHWLVHDTLIRAVSCIILCTDTQKFAIVATSQGVWSQGAGTLQN